MSSFARFRVVEVLSERTGLQRVRVGAAGTEDRDEYDGERAYVLTQLTGPVGVGDEVIVNTTAMGLGLGTGGWHVIHWNLSRDGWDAPGPGHIMKLRYSSLQADVGAAEETHGELSADLGAAVVVAAGLHSQVPLIAAAVRHQVPGARISYVMTDGAALPMALSDLVAGLVDADLVNGTVTAGHAFGGDLEAVGVPSALTQARHIQAADVIIVAMGPGVVGTGTRLGTTALEVAPVLDAAAWLGATPVACLRVSGADARDRHRGISHHSITALEATRSPVIVAVPPDLDTTALDGATDRHRIMRRPGPDVAGLLAGAGIRVTTMGRGADEEPEFFAAASSAGAVAADLLDGGGATAGEVGR